MNRLRLPYVEMDFYVVALLIGGLVFQATAMGQGRDPNRYPLYEPQKQAVQPPVQREFRPPAQEYKPAKVLAIVGGDRILAGEVYGRINLLLAEQMEKIPPKMFAENQEKILREFQLQREMLVKQILPQLIDNKILFVGYKQFEIPSDKLKEAEEQMAKKAPKAFKSSLDEMREKIKGASKERVSKLVRQQGQVARLALIMRDKQLNSIAELDIHLKQYGSSVKQQTQEFLELGLGKQYLASQVNRNVEITHQEMLDYYYAHPSEFAVQAKARWEQLSVYFDKVADETEADRTIAEMGNKVVYGASFAAVAKRSSHGATASSGGKWDWTTQGNLRSKELDAAIFQLPLNRLSQTIRDDRGIHIIRVVERVEEGKIDFKEAQVEIREDLKSKKLNADFRRALKKVKEQVKPVEILLD